MKDLIIAFVGYMLLLPGTMVMFLALVFPREFAKLLLAYDKWLKQRKRKAQ